MPNPTTQPRPLLRAIAGKKRAAAERLEARAAEYRRAAEELEAEADRQDAS